MVGGATTDWTANSILRELYLYLYAACECTITLGTLLGINAPNHISSHSISLSIQIIIIIIEIVLEAHKLIDTYMYAKTYEMFLLYTSFAD